MKTKSWHFYAVFLIVLFLALPANAGSVKVYKVLPHYLDKEGRHTLSPSLFERDRYQALLKTTPQKCSTVRFDVLWRNTTANIENLNISIEIRGTKQSEKTVSFSEKLPSKRSIWSKWKKITIPEEIFLQVEGISAWRVMIRDGETVLCEYCSFLWEMNPEADNLDK